MSKSNSKKQKRVATTRQTGVNTTVLPIVASAPAVDGQNEPTPLTTDQPIEVNTSAVVVDDHPERNDTAIIEAAATPADPSSPDADRLVTTALETPAAPSANGNSHYPDPAAPTPIYEGMAGNEELSSQSSVLSPKNGNGHYTDLAATTAIYEAISDDEELSPQPSILSPHNGNGHYANFAPTTAIYEAAANEEQLSPQSSVLSTELSPQPSALSTSVRPRRYPLSHTGVKHGARLVSRSPRLEALQERRLAASAAAASRIVTAGYAAVRHLPGRRPPISDRRYPIFLMRQRGAEPKKGGAGLRIFITLALLFFITFGAVVGGLVGGYFVYARDLPSINNLGSSGSNFETTRIYDRNGILLAEIYDQGRRTYEPLSNISKYLIQATVATEDPSFYSNPGVDLTAIVRAVFINFSGRGTSGASTITQQLARDVLLTDQRYAVTFDRKLKEAILAVQLTQAYSKDQILEVYLNQIYYGNLAYGIEAASESYFGIHASELTLPEAALLAGLPQSPSDYDPTQNFDLAKRRQVIVLHSMQKAGYISPQEEQIAEATAIVLHPAKVEVKAPHFVQYVKEYLDAQYGPDVVSRGGLVVTTTLDLRVQAEAERAAVARVSALKELSATNAAMVVMKPDTGEILAMVGSVDYNNTAIDGQVNVATRERQPGSSLKPIVYAAAFQQGWNPTTSILDEDTQFGYRSAKPYEPHNYDGLNHGWVTVRTALANSFNIPAVKALQFAGIQNVLDLAHSMGIKNGLYRSPDWYGLSLALGGGEVTLLEETNAYATFANGGREVDATPILKMTDSRGNVLQAVDPNVQGKQVLDSGIAYQIDSILSDNQARSREFGLNSPLHLSFTAAAKTGTTDDNRDSWTMGYTPNLVAGVWVGNNDNSQMKSVTGALGAAYIWHDFMESFYANPDFKQMISYNLPAQTLASGFTMPTDVVRATVCTQAKGDVTDYFIADKVPTSCKGYKDPPQNKVRGYAGDVPIARPTPAAGGNGYGAGNGNSNSGGNSGNSGGGTTTQPNGSTNNGNGQSQPPGAAQPVSTPVTNPGKPAKNGG